MRTTKPFADANAGRTPSTYRRPARARRVQHRIGSKRPVQEEQHAAQRHGRNGEPFERLRESTPQQTAQGERHQQNGERDAHEVDDDADQPGIRQHVIAVQVALNPDTHHRKAEKRKRAAAERLTQRRARCRPFGCARSVGIGPANFAYVLKLASHRALSRTSLLQPPQYTVSCSPR